MYNFDKLARKCKLYYFKKMLLFTLLPIALLTTGFFAFHFYTTQQTVKKPIKKPIKKIKKIKEVVEKKSIATTIIKKPPILEKKKERVTKVKNNTTCYYLQFFVALKSKTKYIHQKEKELTKLGFECYIYEGKRSLYLRCNRTRDYNTFLISKKIADSYHLNYFATKTKCPNKSTKKTIKIQKQKSKEVLAPQSKLVQKQRAFKLQSKKYTLINLKKLFQERKSYNLALKVADYYYNAQKYDNTIKWAKIANAIDKTDEASWILYAKALYAKKEYKKAKKILQIYTQFENSTKVNTLLSDWSNK